MYMKPNNADTNMWAQTVNQKLKHNAQTQDADAIYKYFLCYV